MVEVAQELNMLEMGKRAKEAAFQLAAFSTEQKNQALLNIADALEANTESILAANKIDIQNDSTNGHEPAYAPPIRPASSRAVSKGAISRTTRCAIPAQKSEAFNFGTYTLAIFVTALLAASTNMAIMGGQLLACLSNIWSICGVTSVLLRLSPNSIAIAPPAATKHKMISGRDRTK